MCGIFGQIERQDRGLKVPEVVCALNAMRHRGPDDEGYLFFDRATGRRHACGGYDTDPRLALPTVPNDRFDVALGHRRLSILDLSPGGHQPMASPDGRYWITFNGEIYNYVELRNELVAMGVPFHTGTDTEVLLAALARWGSDTLPRLVGMFAFGLLDLHARTLLLARDCFGIKPLYYRAHAGSFAFASEIKALLQLSGIQRQANEQSLYDYLQLGIIDNGTETFFAGIDQLPAACSLSVSLDDPVPDKPQVYWSLRDTPASDLGFSPASAKLRELFLDSIRLHLRSDVPVGACLSGGIDSTSIVMGVRELSGRDAAMHSFSFIARGAAVDEERWVDVVASAAGTTAHKVQIRPVELRADLDALVATQDEPFLSTSIYAQYRVFRLAHEMGIKVLLDGQGADELLAGYNCYRPSRLNALLKSLRFAKAYRFLRGSLAQPGVELRHFSRAALRLLPSWSYAAIRRWFSEARSPAWLNADWFSGRGVAVGFAATTPADWSLREQLIDMFTRTNLPSLLRYEDRNSMAFSLESRVPFLSRPLVEFIFSLPDEYLLSPDGVTKRVFREAMRGLVPDVILDRRDKIGFATPEVDLLAAISPEVVNMLQSEAAHSIPAIDLPSVRMTVEDVLSGRQAFTTLVWRWLALVLWTKHWNVSYN